MTEHVKTGGPAFPKLRSLNNCKPGEKMATYTSDGMTLRDYFAAKAMQAMVSSDTHMATAANNKIWQQPAYFLAIASYEFADAMLRAREGVK